MRVIRYEKEREETEAKRLEVARIKEERDREEALTWLQKRWIKVLFMASCRPSLRVIKKQVRAEQEHYIRKEECVIKVQRYLRHQLSIKRSRRILSYVLSLRAFLRMILANFKVVDKHRSADLLKVFLEVRIWP